MYRHFYNLLLLLIITFFASQSFAGPPFITDDPPPVDYKQWQFILFSTWSQSYSGSFLQAPGLEIDYGVMPNLEFGIITAIASAFPRDERRSTGLGDTQLGIKYRFIEETQERPQVSIAPLYYIPSGNARKNLGNGRSWQIIPIWLQKSWGTWTSYGGGGIALNAEPETQNYYFGGWVLQRTINTHWMLGAEIFSQTKSSIFLDAFTLVNLGGAYQISKSCAILFSVGHTILGDTGSSAYLGLQWLT